MDAGAAQRVADAALTAACLAVMLQSLADDRAKLLDMARAARAVARIDAAEKLYQACLAAERA